MHHLKSLCAALVLFAGTMLAQQIPSSKHVYIVAEENISYEHEVGSANMPYLNSLIKQGALATQFYANQHSSLCDYFWVTAGQVMTTNNDTLQVFDVDNIVRHTMRLGLTYKSYAETLPYAGYAGLYSGNYMKRHAPLPYYSDMGNSSTQMLKHVPMSQFVADLNNNDLPNFAFITPNATNDMHNCPNGMAACEQRADAWLKTYLQPLLARPEFQPGGDGLLILWADEADLNTDNRCSATVSKGCGGRVLVAMIGPKVKKGYQSTITYHHQNVLRTMLQALGTTSNFPGAANTAAPMADFFVTSSTTTTTGVTISSPAANSTVTSPMHVAASATAGHPITAMQVYVDSQLAYKTSGSTIDTYIPVAPGSHNVVVQSWDTTGAVQKRAVTVNAVTGTTTQSLAITSPLPNATTTQNVQITAAASNPASIAATAIYIDNVQKYSVKSGSVNTTLPVSLGGHNIVVQNWDLKGNVTKASVTITAK